MRDEELMNFGALKLGTPIENRSGWLMYKTHLPGVVSSFVWKPFALCTDWDLLRQGMEEAGAQGLYTHVDGPVGNNGGEVMVGIRGLEGASRISSIREIPRAFWAAWYRLESLSSDNQPLPNG